ncbi:lanC-like protein 1 [Cimex lectularius]|uniref:LanC-like protein n=1 Tax=Cimex lectularius TaxID=79782 RepID=A0A8I6RAD7_CIMLE|nr:lanC-like protein 1 [Cimex lectularius]
MDTVITNPYPEFSEEIKNKWLQDGYITPELDYEVCKVIEKMYCKLVQLVPLYNEQSDYTIYSGYGGTAFLSYKMFKKYGDEKYFEVAKYLTNLALMNLKNECISFLKGDAGPLALGILINMIDEDYEKADQLIGDLIELGDADENNPFMVVHNDILSGRAGYLYALIFVDQQLDEPVIPEMFLRKQVEQILISGFRLAKREASLIPLEYEFCGLKFLGAAHGIAGTLYMLLIANRYLTDYELNCIIRPTLNSLFAARLHSQNFAMFAAEEEDELVQWCHGAPGMIHLAVLASMVYFCPSYYKMALDFSSMIWKRGLLKKGYSICHGVAGNAYIFLYLYKKTQLEVFLYKAACFGDYCLNYPVYEGMKPDWPYSLFQGMAGIIHFLMDLRDPISSCFPCYELDVSK